MAAKIIKNKIEIETSNIDKIIEDVALSCYGVVCIAYSDNPKKGNAYSGIVTHRYADHTLSIDIYITILSNLKVSEVLREFQNQVNYILGKKYPGIFRSVNVFVNNTVDSVNKN